ncbi:MAG: trypsin-like peptidase domain-containing protein [Saprospiraceae bacterium]
MNAKTIFKFLLWSLLLGGGFIAGVAWKNTDQRTHSEKEERALLVKNETAADPLSPVREESPDLGLTAEETATIKLFENAAPSVCFITTSNVRQDYWTRNVMEIPGGTGSGFVWDNEGHIVTNFHVIQKADRYQVTLSDQSTYDATLIGVAPDKDLAVLKIDLPRNQLRPVPLGNSGQLRVGQSVFAIGNPFGLDQTLTTGIVSALGREIQSVAKIPIRDVIQTDAAINPGNSGGPLLDSSGRLIGVNTAIYSPSGASAGIGFSIPVNVVRWVVPDLIQYGKVKRPVIGFEPAAQQIMQRLGLEGVLVLEVHPNSPAEKAGIKPTYRNRAGKIILGDIITGLNGKKIKSFNDLFLELENFKPGERISLELLQEEQKRTVELTLGESE